MGGLGGSDDGGDCDFGAMSEEEEDVDMGGMFGGDDEDYGCESYSAPVRAAAAAVPEKYEEPEDVDMGGLFGDDDDDYGCESYSAPAKK